MRSRITILISIILAFIYLYFVTQNADLIKNDEAYNMEFAGRIWLQFKQNGFVEFVRHLYWSRSMRPNILTPIGATLITSFGTYSYVQAILTFFQISMLSFGLFRIFSQKKSVIDFFSLMIAGAAFPWVFHALTIFSSEGLGLIFFVWAYVFIRKVDFEHFEDASNIPHLIKASVFAGLMILAKPVEGVLIFAAYFLLISFIIPKSFKKGLQTSFFILSGLIGPILYCSYLIMNKIPGYLDVNTPFSYFIYSLLTLPLFFLGYHSKNSRNYILYVFPCAVIAYLWYGPFAYSTFSWAFESSLGKMAQITGNRNGEGSLDFFSRGLYSYFGPIVLSVIAYNIFCGPKWSRSKAVFFVSLFFPFIAGAVSYNSDLRYYIFSCYGIFLVTFDNVEVSRLLKLKTINGLALGVIAVLLVLSTYNATVHGKTTAFMIPNYFGIWPKMFSREPDLLPAMIADLEPDMNLRKPNLLCLLRMPTNGPIDQTLDPWAATIILREKGKDAEIIMPFPHSHDNTADRFQFDIKPVCCYVAVFPTKKYIQAPITHAMSDVGELFLQKESEGKLSELSYSYQKSYNWRIGYEGAELRLYKSENGVCR